MLAATGPSPLADFIDSADLVNALPPVIATFLVGLVASVAASIFTSARKMRADIKADAEILNSLPLSRERTDLRSEIGRKLVLLISYSKYPTITQTEVTVGSLGLLLAVFIYQLAPIIGSSVARSYGSGEPDLDGVRLLLFFSVTTGVAGYIYVAVFGSWRKRTAARLKFVQKSLGDKETRELSRGLLLPANVIPVAVSYGMFWTVLEVMPMADAIASTMATEIPVLNSAGMPIVDLSSFLTWSMRIMLVFLCITPILAGLSSELAEILFFYNIDDIIGVALGPKPVKPKELEEDASSEHPGKAEQNARRKSARHNTRKRRPVKKGVTVLSKWIRRSTGGIPKRRANKF